jgi:hypothetical protein
MHRHQEMRSRTRLRPRPECFPQSLGGQMTQGNPILCGPAFGRGENRIINEQCRPHTDEHTYAFSRNKTKKSIIKPM